MGSHGDNVDNAAWLAGFDQLSNHALHHQKRGACIGIKESLPTLGTGVQKRAAIGCTRRVHKAVDAPEALQSRGDEVITVLWNRDVGLHKEALRPHRVDASSRVFALVQASTAKNDPTRSFPRASRLAMANPRP